MNESDGPEQEASDACPNCGAEFPIGRGICPECGAMSFLESIRKGRLPTGEPMSPAGGKRASRRTLTGTSGGDILIGLGGVLAVSALLMQQQGAFWQFAAGYCGSLAALVMSYRKYPVLAIGIGTGLIIATVGIVLIYVGAFYICADAVRRAHH